MDERIGPPFFDLLIFMLAAILPGLIIVIGKLDIGQSILTFWASIILLFLYLSLRSRRNNE
jgi:hypothetical protein